MKTNSKFIILYLIAIFVGFTSTSISQEKYLFEHISVADGLSSSRFNVNQTIFQDKFGMMWFATVDGLNRYDGFNFKVYKNIPGDTSSLPSSNITALAEDAEGNLWVGTNSTVSKLNRINDTFTHYRVNSEASNNQRGNVSGFLLDSKNNFWVTTVGLGVFRLENKKFNPVPFLIEIADSTIEQNLGVVFGIDELKNGNIFIAEFNRGVFFYNENNNRFEKFSIPDYNNENLISIYEDKTGKIWLTGRNFASYYNPRTHLLKKLDEVNKFISKGQEVFFHSPYETEENKINFAAVTVGLLEYDPANNEVTKIEYSQSMKQRGIGKLIGSIYVDNFGVNWLGQFDNGLVKFDPNRKPIKTYPFEEVENQSSLILSLSLALNRYNPNEIYIGTGDGGIFKFNSSTRISEKLDIKIPSLYTNTSNMQEIVFDENNNLWFYTSNTQLSSFNLKTKKSESYNLLKSNSVRGTGGRLRSLVYIPGNQILIGGTVGIKTLNTLTGKADYLPNVGTRQYSDQILNIVREKLNKNKILASLSKAGEAANLNKVISLKEGKKVLVVGLGEGNAEAGMFDLGEITTRDSTIIWDMREVYSTFYHGGGYKNRLVIKTLELSPGEYNAHFRTDIGHSYGQFNVLPPNDSSWYGLQVVELNDDEFNNLDALLSKEIKEKDYPKYFETDEIIKSKKYPNTIWFGAGTSGLFRYDLTSGKYKQYIPEKSSANTTEISRMFEDNKGILWLVLDPSGFIRFDPEKERFLSNDDIPDLPNAAVNSIIEDFEENLWVSSSVGITKVIRPQNGGNWTTTQFDSKDGVPGGFVNGSVVAPNGEIFFGTINGITAFFPSSENLTKPIPIITNIAISDKSLLLKNSPVKLDSSIFEINKLNLSFSQNYVSFEFAALHYSRPSKNRVLYKLDGFNEDWIFSDRNFASYTNLEPGDYTFRVKAISGFGVESDTDRKIHITVFPPWYRTTWAYIGYIFFFAGIVFGIDRIQRVRLLSKAKERMKIQAAEHRAEAAELQSRALQAETQRKTKELEEARQLQLSMLPSELPALPNLDIAVYMQTATEVGGDYYDFHVGLDGTLTVVLGDATGHGMKAGTMVTSTKSLFNTLAPNPDIVKTFHEMTRCLKLMQLEKLSMCMTMLKITGNKVKMSAAGMPPVFLYKRENHSVEEKVMKGMPLGTFSEFPYTLLENELSTGDTILLTSDGLPELFNYQKEMFGYKQTRNLFEENAHLSAEEIIRKLKEAATSWTDGKDPDDDVTFVVIKVK